MLTSRMARFQEQISQSLIVDANSEITIIDELMNGQHCIIRFNDSLGDLKSFKSKFLTRFLFPTFGDGKTENVAIMRSGYSYIVFINTKQRKAMHDDMRDHTSLTFDNKSVPRPAPVPPPREC